MGELSGLDSYKWSLEPDEQTLSSSDDNSLTTFSSLTIHLMSWLWDMGNALTGD